jgi:hypothetical protein
LKGVWEVQIQGLPISGALAVFIRLLSSHTDPAYCKVIEKGRGQEFD